MKILFVLLALVAPLLGAEAVFVTAGTTAYAARTITGATEATVMAPLADGGLGLQPNAAWAGKVVWLNRGGNGFAEKVGNAATSGAVAVIIANNAPGPVIVFRLGDDSTSLIPAVSVSQVDGAALKAKAGSVVRVGTAASVTPPATGLPDPVGHKGEVLTSDGAKWQAQKLPDADGTTMAIEVAAGKPVSVAIAGDGSPPLSYQWLKDGANLPGRTTAVLAIASASAADAGTYVCMVSNPTSFAPSGALTITVK